MGTVGSPVVDCSEKQYGFDGDDKAKCSCMFTGRERRDAKAERNSVLTCETIVFKGDGKLKLWITIEISPKSYISEHKSLTSTFYQRIYVPVKKT